MKYLFYKYLPNESKDYYIVIADSEEAAIKYMSHIGYNKSEGCEEYNPYRHDNMRNRHGHKGELIATYDLTKKSSSSSSYKPSGYTLTHVNSVSGCYEYVTDSKGNTVSDSRWWR